MSKHDADFLKAMYECGELSKWTYDKIMRHIEADDITRANIEEMLYTINNLNREVIETEQGKVEMIGYREVLTIIHKYTD